MKKVFVISILIFSLSSLFAQETKIRSNKNFFFQEGKALFIQQKYGAAKKSFEKYLSQSNNNSGFYADASYYVACCAYELNYPNTDEILKDFVDRYPYYPMSQRILFMLGRLYFEDTKYKQASTYLSKVEPEDLNEKEAEEYYFAKGFCLLQQKDYQGAKMNFLRINYSDKYVDDKNYYIAYCEYCMEQYDFALEGFKRCKMTRYEEQAMYHMLQIYEQMGESDQAVSIGEKLIEKYPDNPNNSEALRILGEASYREKDYDKTIKYLSKYEEYTKKVQREDMFMLGMSYYEKKNYSEAVKYLSKATTKRDEIAENAYFVIGKSSLKTNNQQKAKMAFYSAYSIGIDKKLREEALYNYAIATYQTTSVFGESTKAFNKFLSEYPSSKYSEEVLNMLSSAYLSEGNYKEALKSINTIKKPNSKILQAKEYILFKMGVQKFNTKNYKKAKEILSESIKLHNDKSITSQAFLFRGEINYLLKDYAGARADLKQFISKNKSSKNPDAAKAFYTMGYSYFNQEQWNSAREWFSQYLSKESNKNCDYYHDAQARIGDTYFYQRNFKRASNEYSKVIASTSTNTDYAIYQKAFIKGLNKHYKDERADMQRLIVTYPNSVYAPKAQYEIGRSYVMENRYNEAISEYEMVLEKYPNNIITKKVTLEIGMLYENMGNKEKAIEAYKKVVEKYPGSEQTNVALESMQNIYVENNDVDSYIEYNKSLGTSGSVSTSKEDSLMYIAAEKVYSKDDFFKAIVSLNNYTNKFCKNSTSTNCINATYYLAESYFETGNRPMALEKYKILATLDGNNYQEQSLLRAADIAYTEQQYEQAAEFFIKLKEVTESGDTKFKAQLGILRCYYQTDNHALVVDNASIILHSATTPEVEREARYSRMKSLVALGDWNSAIDDLEFLKNDVSVENGAEASYLLAEYYYFQNQMERSEEEVVLFIGKKSPYQYWVARSFILLADIYIAKKDDFQAKQYLITLQENYNAEDEIGDMINARLADIATREKEEII